MSCRWSGRMNSPECSCRPHTDALQAKRDAFLRQCEDGRAVMKNVADKYPDGTTSADLRDLELLGTGKPSFRAGSFSDDLDFDGMVKEARSRLFGRSTRDGRPLDNVNHPVFGDALTQAEVWEASFGASRLRTGGTEDHLPVPVAGTCRPDGPSRRTNRFLVAGSEICWEVALDLKQSTAYHLNLGGGRWSRCRWRRRSPTSVVAFVCR